MEDNMKHIPERMCVGCRRMKPKNTLIKIIRDRSDGTVKIDIKQKLFGRGAYMCLNEDCLKTAVKKKGLERVFKEPMSGLYEEIDKILIGNKNGGDRNAG